MPLAAAAVHALQAKLAGPIVELLQQHDQAIDPNLMQLAEAWRQVEAALAAQGKPLPDAAAAAAGEADDDEQEASAEEGHTTLAAEDLQVIMCRPLHSKLLIYSQYAK